MKKVLKSRKLLAVVMVVAVLICVASIGAMPASADSASTFVDYALAQVGKTRAQLGLPDGWCSFFVGYCAKQTGLTSVIPYEGAVVNLYNTMLNNYGATTVTTPQKGDLVFYYCTTDKCWCHVGIMIDSVNSVQGNVTPYNGNTPQVVKIDYKNYRDVHGDCYTVTFVRPRYVSEPHVHSYDTYVYFWKSHPHYKCYACSCGDVKENRNEPTFVDYCEDCQREAQEALFSKSSKITFDAIGGELSSYSTSCVISGYNEARGAEQLIIYNNQGAMVDTNTYGCEVAVDANGCVIATRGYGETDTLTVPNGGFVVSNHSYKNWWISEQAPKGSYVAYDVSAKMVYVYNTKEAYETENKRLALGEKYGVLPTPEYAGYTFDGWYTDPVDGTLVTADSVFNGTTKLYAHWTPNGDDSSDDTDKRIGDVNRDGSIDMKDVLLLRKYIAGYVKHLG